MTNTSIKNAFNRIWQHTVVALNGKSDTSHKHDNSYDPLGAADEVLVSAKEYTDTKTDNNNIVALNSISMGRTESSTIGKSSVAAGDTVVASGENSFASGYKSQATAKNAIALGYDTRATFENAFAVGDRVQATSKNAHAEGFDTRATKTNAHAEGRMTEANGEVSHAEGNTTKAEGYATHSEGDNTLANAFAAHAEGYFTQALSAYQHVQGKYNVADSENVYAHILGNGTSVDLLNIHTVRWEDGQGYFQGGTTATGADYAEYFEWVDKNPTNEDRIGLLVTLDGGKIKLANPGDKIIGIISGTAAVLGDNYECEWNGKYLKDDFGRTLYEEVEEFASIINDETGEVQQKSLGVFKRPILNPDYDPEQTYVNRANRQEWDVVGMMGKLYLKDDGTCLVNKYVTASENGIATLSTEETNMIMLSRVNENVIRVLLK